MECAICGAKLLNGALFCTKCGAKIAETVTSVETQTRVPAEYAAPNSGEQAGGFLSNMASAENAEKLGKAARQGKEMAAGLMQQGVGAVSNISSNVSSRPPLVRALIGTGVAFLGTLVMFPLMYISNGNLVVMCAGAGILGVIGFLIAGIGPCLTRVKNVALVGWTHCWFPFSLMMVWISIGIALAFMLVIPWVYVLPSVFGGLFGKKEGQ